MYKSILVTFFLFLIIEFYVVYMKLLNLQPELEDDKYEKYITDQMHAIQPEILSK